MTLNLAPYDDKSLEKIIRSMLSTNERSLIAMDYQFCECRRETDLLLKNILPVMTMYTGNPRSAYAFVQAIRSYWCRMNCSPAQTDRVVTTNSFNSNDTSDYTHRSWHLDQSIIGKKKDIKQLSYLSDAVDRQKCQMFTGLSPHMEKSMILPQDRRILIVASFIASHSPKEMDANIFLPLSRGKKSKRNHLREENSINESNKKYYFDDSRLVNLFLCLRNVVNSDQSILRNILSKVSKHRTDSKLSDSDVQIMTQVNRCYAFSFYTATSLLTLLYPIIYYYLSVNLGE